MPGENVSRICCWLLGDGSWQALCGLCCVQWHSVVHWCKGLEGEWMQTAQGCNKGKESQKLEKGWKSGRDLGANWHCCTHRKNFVGVQCAMFVSQVQLQWFLWRNKKSSLGQMPKTSSTRSKVCIPWIRSKATRGKCIDPGSDYWLNAGRRWSKGTGQLPLPHQTSGLLSMRRLLCEQANRPMQIDFRCCWSTRHC